MCHAATVPIERRRGPYTHDDPGGSERCQRETHHAPGLTSNSRASLMSSPKALPLTICRRECRVTPLCGPELCRVTIGGPVRLHDEAFTRGQMKKVIAAIVLTLL